MAFDNVFVRLMRDGEVVIILTPAQAKLFVEQGDDSTFKGNDLLYPIYEEIKFLKGEETTS